MMSDFDYMYGIGLVFIFALGAFVGYMIERWLNG